MGVSYNVYVGPYIEVHNPPKSSFEEYHGCSSKKCQSFNQRSSSKFCPHCGSSIVLIKKSITAKVNFDCFNECDDRLSEMFQEYPFAEKKNYSFFVPNVGKLGRHFYAYDTELAEISSEEVVNQVKQMDTAFSKDIDKMRKVFGDAAVKLRWGVMGYSS